MNRHTDRYAGGQTGTDLHTDEHRQTYVDRKAGANTQTDEQADRQTYVGRQADTDTQTQAYKIETKRAGGRWWWWYGE